VHRGCDSRPRCSRGFSQCAATHTRDPGGVSTANRTLNRRFVVNPLNIQSDSFSGAFFPTYAKIAAPITPRGRPRRATSTFSSRAVTVQPSADMISTHGATAGGRYAHLYEQFVLHSE
jgi:hypothetical protein